MENQLTSAQNNLNNSNFLLNTQKNLFNNFSKNFNDTGVGGQIVSSLTALTSNLHSEELYYFSLFQEICTKHDFKKFNEIINQIHDINFQDINGKTILMIAINAGFYSAVDILLQNNVNVNLIDNIGENALICAGSLPHLKYFVKIAQLVDNINYIKPVTGENILHILMRNYYKGIFTSELSSNDIILEEIADCPVLYIDSPGPHNIMTISNNDFMQLGNISFKTCIEDSEIIFSGQVNRSSSYDGFKWINHKAQTLIKYLIQEKNININAVDKEGNNALHIGVKLFEKNLIKKEVIKFLLDNHIKDSYNILNHSAFDEAMFSQNLEIINIFLKAKNIDIETAKLWWGTRTDNLELVKAQLSKLVNINALIENVITVTPFFQAAISNSINIMNKLIDSGADINKLVDNGNTPLSFFINKKNTEYKIVLELINMGADINFSDTNGYTNLHLAAYRENIAIVKLLLERGISTDAQNNLGETTMHLILKYEGHIQQKLEMIKCLIYYNASSEINDNLGHDAIYYVNKVISQNLDVNNCTFRILNEIKEIIHHPETLTSLEGYESTMTGISEQIVSLES